MSDNKRILCVGCCVLDMIHSCKSFPEEDSKERSINGYWQRGGNASNNCTVLQQLNISCEFLGILSNSSVFNFLKEDLRFRGIEMVNCPNVRQDPPFSSIILNQEKKSRTIIHSNCNFPYLKYEDFRKINLNNYNWIHFEARCPDETFKMMKFIVEYNNKNLNDKIIISLEIEKIKDNNLNLGYWADVIFISKDVAANYKWSNSKEAVYKMKKKIGKKCTMICAWGSIGSSVLDANNEYYFAKPFIPTNVVDTLGAGDTFCAATIYAMAVGKSPKDAILFGNEVAGYKISFNGFDKIGEQFKNAFKN